jgi:hypothetical protein
MLEKTILALPLVWRFAPNVLPQPLQSLTVKSAIDDLTKGYEFLVDNSLDVELDALFSSAVNSVNSTATIAA